MTSSALSLQWAPSKVWGATRCRAPMVWPISCMAVGPRQNPPVSGAAGGEGRGRRGGRAELVALGPRPPGVLVHLALAAVLRLGVQPHHVLLVGVGEALAHQ